MAIDSEIQRFLEDGTKNDEPKVNYIEGAQRSDYAPLVKETPPLVIPKAEKTIEGRVRRYVEKNYQYEDGYFIVLSQQKLAVYEGHSKEGQLLHSFSFPHGADYRFLYESKILIISEKNGEQIKLAIVEDELNKDLLMEWQGTKLFSEFEMKSEDKKSQEFDQINYSFSFNHLSFREFGNVYNQKYMNFFQNYSNVDKKLNIMNAVEFKHFCRPNRLMTSQKQKYIEEIENHIKQREFIQWAPSRDWSRLFVLSLRKNEFTIPSLHLEFYDFNRENQIILSSPQRINLLSQLLRPQWIKDIKQFDRCHPIILIDASFTGDRIAFKTNDPLIIYDFNQDWTIAGEARFLIEDGLIESISLSCSKLTVQSNGFFYEYKQDIETRENNDLIMKVSLAKDFSKTDLKNIIQCGIFDILIYEKHVKIFNNINPMDQQDELEVNDEILQLLISQKFIQLDDYQIACLPQPLKAEANIFQIIDISQDNLVNRGRDQVIQLLSPWSQVVFSDCQFDLIKFKENEYAAFIVTSPNQQGQFYQYYSKDKNYFYFLMTYQKSQSDYIKFQQIPHLPYVTSDGHLFYNCEMNHNSNQLELDILKDECEILNQDEVNINSQQLEVYDSCFKNSLFTFIEEKEDFYDKEIQSEQDFYSIEIPELNTLVSIRLDAADSQILIFQPSLKSMKHLILKQPMTYLTHKVIYRDSQYYVSIILQTKENDLYEVWMSFDLAGVTLAPLKFIMKMKEAQNLDQSHLSADLTLSLFFNDPEEMTLASVCWIRKYSSNSKGGLWSEQEETFKLEIKNNEMQATAQQVSSIIMRIAQSQSIRILHSILKDFAPIIYKKTQIYVNNYTYCFAFMNKIILFSPQWEYLTILDDQLTVISTVFLRLQAPIQKLALVMDYGVLEYIDVLNNRFPFPLMGSSQDSLTSNKIVNKYTYDFRYPMPFSFGLHDGLISHVDLKSEKLLFYLSEQDKQDGNISARIEIIAQRESFIDDIINGKERKNIEELMNKIDINLLLSFNIHKRVNLITGTKNHAEKDLIYSVLFKRLEIEEIKELPMLLYNTSVDTNSYETILDVLVENKAIKLAQLIVSIAIKQDQIGYIYNRLGLYLSIFSANELQMFIGSQIFLYQIPTECYEEYQIQGETLIKPNSDYNSFAEIKKNMKIIESQMLQIEEAKVIQKEKKNPELPEEGKKEEKLMNSQKDAIHKNEVVPIEYFAINLMQLINSKQQPIKESHREVIQVLNQLVETDPSILERECMQIIIDFKWDSYAWNFFSVQLFLFICFIIAFIIDIVAVSQNSHIFSSQDQNQVIPRFISLAIMIPFAIYEIANIKVDIKRQLKSFWNVNDLLLYLVYAAYFTISFAKPDQKDVLKSLQLIIVIFSFIKFSFLIRIWTKVSFLVRMLIVVFKELLIFLFYFLLVIGGLTVMAQIIIEESGDQYDGIKVAAFFVIVLRQSIGDYDTSSIIEGTKEFKILAWLLWFLILVIGNIVFMNFIIAVVSESYENCMDQKIQLIYNAKLEMIEECEDLMPEWLFTKRNWFPRFIIIRRQQGSGAGGDNPEEWQGFVKQMKRHLEHENGKLNEMFIQNINRSTESTKRELEGVKRDTAEVKKDTTDIKKEISEMKRETAEVKVLREQINDIMEILQGVYRDKIVAINAEKLIKAQKTNSLNTSEFD